MFNEFKKFALKGNVIDMAVGVVIGGAFGKIVTSFVNDLLTPALGVLIGGINVKGMSIVLVQAQGETPAVLLNYGNFLQTVIDFSIISFSIFLTVKAMNSMKKKEEEKPSEPAAPVMTKEQELLSEIRDLLKK